MGWAKYEEDNREAMIDRYSSGNYFWTPYKNQENTRADSYYSYVQHSQQNEWNGKKNIKFSYSY